MKKIINETGVVHVSTEYRYGWWHYCAPEGPASDGGDFGYVVHHDTVVTCIACVVYLARRSAPEKTHKPVYEDGVIVRDKNGYYLISCVELSFSDKKGIDSSFINDKNPSCYVCRKLK